MALAIDENGNIVKAPVFGTSVSNVGKPPTTTPVKTFQVAPNGSVVGLAAAVPSTPPSSVSAPTLADTISNAVFGSASGSNSASPPPTPVFSSSSYGHNINDADAPLGGLSTRAVQTVPVNSAGVPVAAPQNTPASTPQILSASQSAQMLDNILSAVYGDAYRPEGPPSRQTEDNPPEERDGALNDYSDNLRVGAASARQISDAVFATPWVLPGTNIYNPEGVDFSNGVSGQTTIYNGHPVTFGAATPGPELQRWLTQDLSTDGFPEPPPAPVISSVDPMSIPLPRPDPRGGVLYPAQDTSSYPDSTYVYADSSAGDPWAGGLRMEPPGSETVAPDSNETPWVSTVDTAGQILGGTAIGRMFSTLFPDVWNDIGDRMKSLTLSPGSSDYQERMRQQIRDDQERRSRERLRRERQRQRDNNSNNGGGKKGHHNGGKGHVVKGKNDVRVVFPNVPPFQPGFNSEWDYFRGRYFKDGGPVDLQDPRVELIMNTDEALRSGQKTNDIDRFVEMFGQPALNDLENAIRKDGDYGRPVEGPGGPKDDMVPALVNGVEPVRLSNGEFIMSADAVKGAGAGDPDAGMQWLMNLNRDLEQKGRGE